VTLRYVSCDGEEGYPGTLTVDATYALDDDDVLTIEYVATTDAPKIVNLTNHSHWNLGGEGNAGDAMGHVVTLLADHFLPTDVGSIPTREIRPVAGTAFDFGSPRVVGEHVNDTRDAQTAIGRGYDHCWIADGGTGTRAMARVYYPASGRGLEFWSNQPGLEFYSGNVLDGTTRGKVGRFYRARDVIAFEPQRLPDTPNRPAFGSMRLAPGELYRNVIDYRLTW
jgi:aldose 1-epimerase